MELQKAVRTVDTSVKEKLSDQISGKKWFVVFVRSREVELSPNRVQDILDGKPYDIGKEHCLLKASNEETAKKIYTDRLAELILDFNEMVVIVETPADYQKNGEGPGIKPIHGRGIKNYLAQPLEQRGVLTLDECVEKLENS